MFRKRSQRDNSTEYQKRTIFPENIELSGISCVDNKNKPPAMQVCSPKALASRKNRHVIMNLRFANQIQYNKEVSEWITTVYYTRNGHASLPVVAMHMANLQ